MDFSLDQSWLIEPYAVMEMFFIGTAQFSDHSPHVTTAHLKCSQ